MNLLYLALSPFAHPAKLFSSSIFEAKELFKGTISVHFWILPLTSFRLENERRSAYIFPHLLYSFLSLPLSLSFFFPLASSEATSLLELTNSSSNRIIRFDRSFRSFPVQNVNLDVYKFNVTSSDVVRVEIVNQNLRPN